MDSVIRHNQQFIGKKIDYEDYVLFVVSVINSCKHSKIALKSLKVDMITLGDNCDLYKTPRVQKYTLVIDLIG